MARWYVRSADRRPDPEPLPTSERTMVWAVTAIWAALLIAALVMRAELADQGRGWWIWTPVTAVALGLYGIRWLAGKGR
ncbi:MAG: hypothetical protein JNL54_18515 [Kineosporiaceae bacterium]|nr:hypothetical protein [Kineosporiaceae bacterium]